MTVEIGNHLTATSFSLSLRDPDGNNMACDIQGFTHPGFNVSSTGYSTPRRNIPVPGDHIEFDSLTVQFILDEDMTIYEKFFDWIKKNYTENDELNFEKKVVDIDLHIRSGQGNRTLTLKYHSAHPTGMGEIGFAATDDADTYLTFNVNFEFSHFTIA